VRALPFNVMGRPGLNPEGGDARHIGIRLPEDTLTGVVLAAAGESVTISEWVRGALDAELMRRQIDLAEAIGQPLLPVPNGGHAPPGGDTAA
jgi:hypothetical protein